MSRQGPLSRRFAAALAVLTLLLACSQEKGDGEALKISALSGGFTGNLVNDDVFGVSLAPIGDIDGNGVEDLAAGAAFDDAGGLNSGAVWILYRGEDGTIVRMDLFGTILQTYDPFGPDDGVNGYAPLSERVWGVQPFDCHLYFGTFSEHQFASSGPNSVWSVEIDGSGAITAGVTV